MEHTHFIGIGGAGLSAMARVLLERGHKVTGSDMELTFEAESLQRDGVEVFIGHKPENIGGAQMVIRSSAVANDNVEVRAAEKGGIAVIRREDYLGVMLAENQVIAVAGSHGKTTTTSMIAWMLTELGETPGFISGGKVENLGVNARAGSGHLFVIEADEYDNMFLGLQPKIAVVTNVEHDHPDFFPTPEDFEQAFKDFVAKLKPDGALIVCFDDAGSSALVNEDSLAGKRVVTYGLSPKAQYQARDLQSEVNAGYHFDVYRDEKQLTSVTLKVAGKHNVLNAMAALIVADLLGLSTQKAALALSEFSGAARRFDVLGVIDGVTIVNDYAHHPTEIRATLSAAKDRYPGHHLWALWQPHTYSRTTKLLSEFSTAFHDADDVIMTPVYEARETIPEDFSDSEVAQAIKHPQVHFANGLTEAGDFLLSQVNEGDVVLVLSAGDAIEVSTRLYWELGEMEEQYA